MGSSTTQRATCTIHLVRHGSHDLLGHVLVGRGDIALSEQGHAEAKAAADALANAGLTTVISSPRLRARQTAEAIVARTNLPLVIEPAFDELDLGEWSGISFDDLHKDPRWQAFNTRRSWGAPPAGETMLAVQARAVAAIQPLRREHPEGTLAIVTHSDVIKAILMYALGMPLDLIHRLDIQPASCSTIVMGDTRLVVQRINVPPG